MHGRAIHSHSLVVVLVIRPVMADKELVGHQRLVGVIRVTHQRGCGVGSRVGCRRPHRACWARKNCRTGPAGMTSVYGRYQRQPLPEVWNFWQQPAMQLRMPACSRAPNGGLQQGQSPIIGSQESSGAQPTPSVDTRSPGPGSPVLPTHAAVRRPGSRFLRGSRSFLPAREETRTPAATDRTARLHRRGAAYEVAWQIPYRSTAGERRRTALSGAAFVGGRRSRREVERGGAGTRQVAASAPNSISAQRCGRGETLSAELVLVEPVLWGEVGWEDDPTIAIIRPSGFVYHGDAQGPVGSDA